MSCLAASLQELTLEQFVERFERPRIPVVITGLTDSWGAGAAWAPSALRARFGEHRFKVLMMHGQHSFCPSSIRLMCCAQLGHQELAHPLMHGQLSF